MAYGIRERKAVTEGKPAFSVHLLIHLQVFSGNEDSFFKVKILSVTPNTYILLKQMSGTVLLNLYICKSICKLSGECEVFHVCCSYFQQNLKKKGKIILFKLSNRVNHNSSSLERQIDTCRNMAHM